MALLSHRAVCLLIRQQGSQARGFHYKSDVLEQVRALKVLEVLELVRTCTLNVVSESIVYDYLFERRVEWKYPGLWQDLAFWKDGSFKAASLSKTSIDEWLTASHHPDSVSPRHICWLPSHLICRVCTVASCILTLRFGFLKRGSTAKASNDQLCDLCLNRDKGHLELEDPWKIKKKIGAIRWLENRMHGETGFFSLNKWGEQAS